MHPVLFKRAKAQARRGSHHRQGGRCLLRCRQPAKAVEIALDVEQLIYDAGTLLNAASLLNRIAPS